MTRTGGSGDDVKTRKGRRVWKKKFRRIDMKVDRKSGSEDGRN